MQSLANDMIREHQMLSEDAMLLTGRQVITLPVGVVGAVFDDTRLQSIGTSAASYWLDNDLPIKVTITHNSMTQPISSPMRNDPFKYAVQPLTHIVDQMDAAS